MELFIRLAILSAGFLLTSCLQTENSSSMDADTYGSAWREIVGTHCSSCHAYHTMEEAQLVAAGLVVAGDPENSKIYYRLSGSAGSNGPKSMPPGGALSAEDISVVRDWITGLH